MRELLKKEICGQITMKVNSRSKHLKFNIVKLINVHSFTCMVLRPLHSPTVKVNSSKAGGGFKGNNLKLNEESDLNDVSTKMVSLTKQLNIRQGDV